jgi:hypothetical protein
MNACQSLSVVVILVSTAALPLNGVMTHAQDATATQVAAPATDIAPAQVAAPAEKAASDETLKDSGETLKVEDRVANPFVPTIAPQVKSVATDPAPAQTDATPLPVSSNVIPTPEITTQEIMIPMIEEVVMPEGTPAVMSVPEARPEIFFDAPAASQSDRRISKEKVAELRQQRALYRANQRMARMEYNLWMGYEPLRPRRSPMPMMNSRYGPTTIVVPVFVNPR